MFCRQTFKTAIYSGSTSTVSPICFENVEKWTLCLSFNFPVCFTVKVFCACFNNQANHTSILKRKNTYITSKEEFGALVFQSSTLGTLYGDYSFPYQFFLMTPTGRIFGAEKNTMIFCASGAPWWLTDSNIHYRFISRPPIQHPNVDKPKSRFISDLSQL